MECLRQFLNSITIPEQEDFAARCETTRKYLRKAINKGQELGPEISVAIEKYSGGKVTREKLHPNTFHKKWPELAQNQEQESTEA